jgi:amino acid transporter
MKWTVIIALILYVSVAFAALGVIGAPELIGLGEKDAEVGVALAANQFLGAFGLYIIIIGALVATASALNATMLGSSRLAYMLAKEKVFPSKFSNISKAKVPNISVFFTAFISILLTLLAGGVLAIASIVSLIFSQIYFIINFTNFKVRKLTNSNAIIPILGMILTATYIIILIFSYIINIETEIFTLTVVSIVEVITIIFVVYLKKKKI